MKWPAENKAHVHWENRHITYRTKEIGIDIHSGLIGPALSRHVRGHGLDDLEVAGAQVVVVAVVAVWEDEMEAAGNVAVVAVEEGAGAVDVDVAVGAADAPAGDVELVELVAPAGDVAGGVAIFLEVVR